MKKVFLTIVLLSSFLLTGCVDDKKQEQSSSSELSAQESTKPSHVDINPPSYF